MARIAGVSAGAALNGDAFNPVEKLAPLRATFVNEDRRARAAAMTDGASSAALEKALAERGCNTRLKTVLSRNPMHRGRTSTKP